jgi:molecular chaperone DnaJ
VSDGMRLHLAGEGEVGFAGGPAGDLYLEVSVRPHLTFGRDGDNLTAVLQIGVADAALGFEMTIEALDGPVDLSVKPGAQNGDQITIRDRGVQKLRGRGRGDLVIELRVQTPDKLDSKQKELFAKLKALRKDAPHLVTQRSQRGRF